ncbi:hypothetical protein [Lactobacillus helveticus]|uniref:hypothetical protein n=1 Tax=Lactobacillus helveticus TaxID=1587 RepID=UPI001486C948|nr:hypothetical protein [Lactobacillus helveticus]
MNNQNQTNLDANKVINKLLNKLAMAEYSQTVLETQVEELTDKNKKLKEQGKNKEAKEA